MRALLLFVCLSSVALPVSAGEPVELSPRSGDTLAVYADGPAEPAAVVLLFAGGKGDLRLFARGGEAVVGNLGNNFLVRTRDRLADHGLAWVLVDAPSNRPGGMNAIYRMSGDHEEDIEAAVEFARERFGAPVWLAGTSMGSFSALNGAIELEDEIDGLLLPSPVVHSRARWKIRKRYPDGVADMDADEIVAPVLILVHEDDACDVSPPSGAATLLEELEDSPRAEIVTLSGGAPATSGPCRALSPHGFYGIEDEAVAAMAAFVTSAAP